MTTPPAPLLQTDAFDGWPLAHGFTTRAGGVSRGALASLNLARRPGESDEALSENWARVAAAVGRGAADVALLDQVHGAAVAAVGAGGGPLRAVATADAAITTAIGVVLAVRTADCVPVLLAAPGGVGVAHAGWRGAALGVVPAAVRALCEATGAAPAAVRAAIGPSIAGQRYEVGHEVVDALAASGVDPARFLVAGPGSRPHVDVADAVEAQLEALGVGRIARVRRCTAEDPELFSHRADGPATGRQAGVVARLA